MQKRSISDTKKQTAKNSEKASVIMKTGILIEDWFQLTKGTEVELSEALGGYVLNFDGIRGSETIELNDDDVLVLNSIIKEFI